MMKNRRFPWPSMRKAKLLPVHPKTELFCKAKLPPPMFSDVDLEDLLSALAPSEIQSLVDEMASDPDDKHLPASVRNSYRCSKEPTGELNRDSLINHINQEGIAGSHV